MRGGKTRGANINNECLYKTPGGPGRSTQAYKCLLSLLGFNESRELSIVTAPPRVTRRPHTLKRVFSTALNNIIGTAR